MKRAVWIMCCIGAISMLVGCSNIESSVKVKDALIETSADYRNTSSSIADIDYSESKEDEYKNIKNDEHVAMPISITIQNSTFTAELYNNETSQALIKKLPLTVNMAELNGQEKYYNFSENLSDEPGEKPKVINEGDIMLWSGNCLVLFYKTYNNSYNGYIPIGHIDDVSGLETALGNGNVTITFSMNR